MNIILGTTGQIVSMIVNNILKKGQPERSVIRNSSKVQELENKGAKVVIAIYFDAEALKRAFQGGSSVFLLTPENPLSNLTKH